MTAASGGAVPFVEDDDFQHAGCIWMPQGTEFHRLFWKHFKQDSAQIGCETALLVRLTHPSQGTHSLIGSILDSPTDAQLVAAGLDSRRWWKAVWPLWEGKSVKAPFIHLGCRVEIRASQVISERR